MGFKIDHLAGFVLGVGVTAVSLVLYLKKGRQIAGMFCRSSSAEPADTGDFRDYADRSLDELIEEKERLEDQIAERELAGDDAN